MIDSEQRIRQEHKETIRELVSSHCGSLCALYVCHEAPHTPLSPPGWCCLRQRSYLKHLCVDSPSLGEE